MNKKILITIIAIIAIAVAAFFIFSPAEADNTNQFITAKAHKSSIEEKINATGMIKPSKTVDVGAQVSGEISKMTVEIGDRVKTGDLIAEIDARTKINAKDTAIAQLESYKAALETAQSDLVKVQQAYDRANKLYKSNAVSREDYDNAAADLNSAKNAVKQAQANVTQSELTIKDADVDLGYATVNAPIDGVVIATPVEEGQTVNASQSAPTLVTLAKTDVMTIKTEIAEADVLQVEAGMPVTFELLGKNAKTYEGKLKSIDPAPKEISDDDELTASTAIYYYADVDIPNPDGIFKYGMTANVTIIINKAEDVLTIPLTAISTDRKGDTTVQILSSKGTAQSVVVETGIDDGVNVEIKSGLTEGDNVIVSDISGTSSSSRQSGPPGGGMF